MSHVNIYPQPGLRSSMPLQYATERKHTLANSSSLCAEARRAVFRMMSGRTLSRLMLQWLPVNDADIQDLTFHPNAGQSLTCLHLSGSEVSDKSAQLMAAHFQNLRELDVSLSRIGGKGVEALSSLAALEALDLSCLEGVEEASLLQLAARCSNLARLGMNRLGACTDGFLMNTVSSCKSLRELSIVCCPHVTQAAVEDILLNPAVQRLDFR